jgi:hypothetical protein
VVDFSVDWKMNRVATIELNMRRAVDSEATERPNLARVVGASGAISGWKKY